MESITSIQELKRNLTIGPGYQGYIQLIKSVELSKSEYKPFCRWSDNGYQRVRFYDTEAIEGLLTCWKPGQKSSIHNYDGSIGWFKVLEGEFDLNHFNIEDDAARPTFTKRLSKGDIGFLSDGLGFHQIANCGDSNCVILVLYADKIEAWQVFDEATKEVYEAKVVCDYNLDE